MVFIVNDIREHPFLIANNLYFKTRELAEKFKDYCVSYHKCPDFHFEVLELESGEDYDWK